jgi:hypothetical protein
MLYGLEEEKYCKACLRKYNQKVKMHEYMRSTPHRFKKEYTTEFYYRCPKCGWYVKKED